MDNVRWGKRLLLILVILGVAGSIAASLTARPSRPQVLLPKSLPNATFKTTVDQVNFEFAQPIVSAGLEACDSADWLTICRRMNLALVGCGLSLEEVRLLEEVPESERIDFWIDRLLDEPRCSDYLAERFTRAFVGTNNGPFLLFRRRKFRLWLADEIQQGRPYDQIVRELIGTDGLWTDKPSVNFLTATMDENDQGRADPVRLAGRTARAFLGMRIDCVQCHDDFLGNVKLGSTENPVDGTQRDFHQLAAFYAGTAIPNKNVFAGIRDDKTPYEVKFLGSEEETEVEAKVPYREDLLPKTGSNRERLATWVTHPENKAFARATVNRVWALMFGKPLITPVDDIPIQGPYPPGMELLANDFIEHGYDLKRLIRMIASLEVFRRDSRSVQFEITTEHESLWGSFPLTQLRPEQVASSIHQACRLKTVDEQSAIISQLEKFGYVNDFTQGFGDRGEDEFIAQTVTIPQRLLMMNGSMVYERTKNNPILNASTRIGALASNDLKAIEVAYLSTLNRLPTEEEQTALVEHLQKKKGDARSHAMADLFWMLINSTEFLWNH